MKNPGGPEQLIFGEVPTPRPGPSQLLVRNHAFSLNYVDILQRKGKYPVPPHASDLLGMDIAGVVEETGAHVTRFKKGDRVMCLLDGGAYAEYSLAEEVLTMPIPENLSFEEAAVIPQVFLTAYQALFLIGEIQPLQWVLIHSGAGGVGSAAIQLCKEAGARPIATCGSLDKVEACISLGATAALNYRSGPFAPKVLELTDGHGVDLILDFIGASYWEQNFHVLAKGGAIVQLATLGGAQIPSFDLSKLMSKWATITGSTLRKRPLQYKARLVKEFSEFALSRFERRTLRPVATKILPWKEVQKAHQLLESASVIGKIVLSIHN
ncbi:MAG TPA: NAD(P)H-quinone oxidoreductase [Rhabdochlamydiaceae bacterium]|nr:NAD(P)H-quinone oxidoreductase [Rhabdochlamydiaceae bacterium]